MPRFVRFLSSLVVVCLSFVAQASTIYDVSSLLSQSGDITLTDGTTVSLASNVADGGSLFFEDKKPGANWAHPAELQVRDPSGALVQKIDVTMPPKGLSNAPVLFGKRTNRRYEVEFKLNNFKGKYVVKDPSKYYAFLFNGAADRRHYNDFAFLYRVLTQIYGYREENIIIADSAYIKTLPDIDEDGDKDIQYGSTRKELEEIMKFLADTLKEDDQLLFAVNDHGSRLDGESTIVLNDGQIKVSEFKKLFDEIKAKRVVSIHEQCFSGGFVRPSVDGSKVAMAAATDKEYSWASMDLRFDEFIFHVISAFAMQLPDGTPVKSDTNRDGAISAQEAFAYAVANDMRPESPVMETGSNAGISRMIGVGF